MRILVCIKAVPDPAATLRLDDAGLGPGPDGLVHQVNEYDLFAMEAAVRIKERGPGTEIVAVTVGPARAEAQLRKAMGLGADRGDLILDVHPAPDAFRTASLIAAWARPQRFDLIICGVISADLQQGLVGPMLAELLDQPAATTVISLDLAPDLAKLTAERELEAGRREIVELTLPALITVQSGLNTPRYASLSNLLRVKRLAIPVVPAEALGPVPDGARVVRALLPERTGRCEFIAGGLDQTADALIHRIRARVPVI